MYSFSSSVRKKRMRSGSFPSAMDTPSTSELRNVFEEGRREGGREGRMDGLFCTSV